MTAEQLRIKTHIMKLRHKALNRIACPEISVIQTSAGHQKIVSEKTETLFIFEKINISFFEPWALDLPFPTL